MWNARNLYTRKQGDHPEFAMATSSKMKTLSECTVACRRTQGRHESRRLASQLTMCDICRSRRAWTNCSILRRFCSVRRLDFLQKIPANSNARQRGHDLLQRFAAITASVLLLREKIFPSMELLHVLSLSLSAAGLLQQRGLLQRWPYILQQFAAVAVHFAAVQRDICSAKKKFKYQEFPHSDLSRVGI